MATMSKDSPLFSVHFDGRDELGSVDIAWLYPDGTFEVYDDD